MTRNGTRAPEVKALAAAAIAEGMSYIEAAEIAGVDRKTLYRWTQSDKEFQDLRARATEDLRTAGVERALATHDRLVPAAVSALGGALAGDDPRLKVRAAAHLLRFHPRFGRRVDVNVGGSLLETWIKELDTRNGNGNGTDSS